MKHLKLFSLTFTLFALFLGVSPASGQTYETDFGWRDSEETPWDGIWPVTNRPVTLANTNQTGFRTALLSLHNAADGRAVQSASIFKRDFILEGRSLAAENTLTPTGGYYLTGFWRKFFFFHPSVAFLVKTDWVGRPQRCMKKVTANFSEWGMVVEKPERDVLVAGNARPNLIFLPLPRPPFVPPAPAPRPPAHFWAARFDAGMTKVWAFDYLSPDTAQFFVHEGCMGIFMKGDERRTGLALTGYYIKKGETMRHTFVSMIDYQTGAEVWRTSCLSAGVVNDEGHDIVQDPESLLFFVVGYGQRQSGGPKRMFTCVVDPVGAFLGSAYHEAALETREMVARDVCLSLERKHAVVTGYFINAQGGGGASDIKTFSTELLIDVQAPATWSVYYDLSFSDVAGSEAIVPFKGDNNFTPGYFITTGGRLFHVPIIAKDAQVIKINPDGSVNCPFRPFNLDPQRLEPVKPKLQFRPQRSVWKKDKLQYSVGDPFSTVCED